MDIENNKEEVPFEHYQELFEKAEAAEMAVRSGAKWEKGKFYVNLLGTEYVISHPEYEIATASLPCAKGGGPRERWRDCSVSNDDNPLVSSADSPLYTRGPLQARNDSEVVEEIATPASPARNDSGVKIPLPVQTFLLRYLLEGKKTQWEGNFKTFREMPWGELYIKPYTGRVLTRAAFTFGTRVAAFKAACEKMGARKLSHGDAGYEFQFLPGFLVQIMVWEGDDEFPPNAQVLYSDNFETGFAPEDRVVVGDILISTIKANM